MLWAVLWLGGSVWSAGRLRAQVEHAAAARLAQAGEPLQNIRAQASGLTITLTGKASRQSEVERAMKLMQEEVRLPGLLGQAPDFNPVRQVDNEIVLELRSEGWGVLAATPSAVHLRGIAASENEANRISLAVRSAGQLGPAFTSQLTADGEAFIASDQLETTIRSTPPLTSQVVKQGLLAVTTWGREWQVLDISKPAEALRRDIVALGLPADAWDTDLFAEVVRIGDARSDWEAQEEEKQRLASLAPGHVVMALRGDQILLRGELGSEQACQLIADSVRITAKDCIVVDELAHSSHRRPAESPRLLATSLPPLPTGLLAKFIAVGTPDTGWKVLNLNLLEVENPASFTQAMLPAGLDLRLVRPDLATALVWINSIDSAPAQQDGSRITPYFMITAVGSHVYLRGAVAEESVRTQVEAAARRVYAGGELDVDVRLDATCLAIGQALQTLATLPPPPPPDTVGFIAFAFTGDEWHSKPIRPRLLEATGLQQSGLLPEGVSANTIMPDLLAVTPAVRAHLARLSLNPPGIPLQPASPP